MPGEEQDTAGIVAVGASSVAQMLNGSAAEAGGYDLKAVIGTQDRGSDQGTNLRC